MLFDKTAAVPYICFKKFIYILASEMASPGNQHCASCIGALLFPIEQQHYQLDSRQSRTLARLAAALAACVRRHPSVLRMPEV